MGVNLSGLINAGTQAAGNYEHAKAQAGQQQIGAIMQAIAMQREQQQDALKQAVAQSTMKKDASTAALADARSKALANPSPKLTPHSFTVDGQPMLGFADQAGNLFDAQRKPVHGAVTPYQATKPRDPVADHAANRDYDLKHPLPVPPSYSFPTVTGPDGSNVVARANNKSGEITPTTIGAKTTAAAGALAAPMAAKVGQAGEMLKKATDILPLMEGLGVSLGQSASADIAQNGVGVGHMRLPGTKGVGNAMVNQTPTYAQYQATLSPFVLAAAHALSGARINQDQVNQIRQSIEIAPGDIKNPQVVAQKRKNMLDLLNSITGSLPADAIGEQEAQIDPNTLAMLEGHGYRRASVRASSKGRGAAPSNARDVPGNIDLRTPTATAAPTKPASKDYGIFGKPPGDEDQE